MSKELEKRLSYGEHTRMGSLAYGEHTMKAVPSPAPCTELFKVSYSRDAVRCELPLGHASAHSHHQFKWHNRVHNDAYCLTDECPNLKVYGRVYCEKHLDPCLGVVKEEPVDTIVEGDKCDNGKPRFDLIPMASLTAIAEVLAYGAAKYGDRNWEKGMGWSRIFAAFMRHIVHWWCREEVDRESGLTHLAHAATNCLFLLEYALKGTGTDDRPRGK